MNDEKLDKNGLIKVWLKFWTLVKLLVGDVDIAGKGDLQTQINHIDNRVDECFRNASDGKKLLANAITGKGVLTKASDTFATMAENISNIKEVDDSVNVESLNYRTGYNAGVAATKKGTAGTGDVLTGKTFTNASSVGANGGMANKGAATVDSGPVTQDDTYTYLAVPAAAFYNTNSKLRTKNSNIKSFVQTQLQVGSAIDTNCVQKYLNIGYSTLAASISAYENDAPSAFTINAEGSNDDVNYVSLGTLSTNKTTVNIKNYRYIKLTCYNTSGYGKKVTWSIQVS